MMPENLPGFLLCMAVLVAAVVVLARATRR